MSNNIQEKVMTGHKNGFLMLVLWIVVYIAAIALVIYGAMGLDKTPVQVSSIVIFVLGLIYVCIGWFPFLGLKVLKPGEALVLTLFGKYVGTIKEDGFYYVNPFCSAVNPAAETKLGQSGDISDNGKGKFTAFEHKRCLSKNDYRTDKTSGLSI